MLGGEGRTWGARSPWRWPEGTQRHAAHSGAAEGAAATGPGPRPGAGQASSKMGAGALPGHFLAPSGLKKELGQNGATVLCSGLWAGARAKEGCANL